MNYDYLAKIKSKIALYSKKKTSNFLDGEFRSVHRGRSFDFDDLREYTYGDNIKDIDWKSSSKTGKTLVRRFIAEKKHNVLFVVDTGNKMCADTSGFEDKSSLGPNMAIALMTTLYGSFIANMFMTPFSTKLQLQNSQEMVVKEMIIEGVLSIQAGDNPRILAMKLLTYLDPVSRKVIESEVLKD